MLSKNQVGEIRALQQKKQRELNRQFIAEGIKTVMEIVQFQAQRINHIYGTHNFIERHTTLLRSHRIAFTLITEAELSRISLLETPNQVLAVCYYMSNSNPHYDFTAYFSLYLDGIRDPGNFGTLLRLAEWFGICKLYCSYDTCELYNPKVIQASMGAFMRVEVFYTSLAELLASERINVVYGAVLDGVNVYQEKLQPGLIVIGNEANGISEENLQYINKPLTIPSAGTNKTESLNAAMAAGIICSEFFRQLR